MGKISSKKLLAFFGVAIVTVVVIVILISVTESTKKDDKAKAPEALKASMFEKAAVAADSKICSTVGADMLRKKGSAADAAVASMLCTCVVNAHSAGIGGGSFLLYYKRSEKQIYVFDYREVAPGNATEDMFVKNKKLSETGGLSIAVPGEIMGLWEVHKQFGNLTWSEVVEPAVKLAENGVPIGKPIAVYIKKYIASNDSRVSQGLRDLFVNKDGSIKGEGDLMINKELAATLKEIQKNATSFYTGELSKKIIKDIQSVNGIITAEDLAKYQIKRRNATEFKLRDNLELHSMPPPGSGGVLAMIQNIMNGYDFSKHDMKDEDDEFDYYQKLVESMKFSYAQRALLGDPDFIPKDNLTKVLDKMTNSTTGESIRKNKITLNQTHDPSYYGGYWGKDDFGTSHLSVLAENGDAVALTSTINYGFGSLFRSNVTGIIYNNEMDDFSTPGKPNLFGFPPTPNNYIRPYKRPLSSMSPTIVTDENGDVKMVVGASGGSRIISGIAQVMLNKLKINLPLGEAVGKWRLHHQGIPNNITYNPKTPIPEHLIQRLKRIGHTLVSKSSISVVQVISKMSDHIEAVSDPRKHGEPDGY